MNKAFILLLIIFVQSQSDCVLLPNANANRLFQDSQLEEWDGEEFPYAEALSEDYKKRSLTTDTFTRRSALDKNFMRFGRGGESAQEKRSAHLSSLSPLSSLDKASFYRSGRGLKDNFIRFGRGGEKNALIRFGRTRPEDFFRAGKSLRENFIRFGKADRNFMRFGRDWNDSDDEDFLPAEEAFDRTEKSSRNQDNFLRFGKNGKNGTNFLRFGKSDFDKEEPEDGSNQDSVLQKDVKRKKRQTDNSKATLFFPQNFFRRISPAFDITWQGSEKVSNPRMTPFFPVSYNFLENQRREGLTTKRNHGSSNFIRFG